MRNLTPIFKNEVYSPVASIAGHKNVVFTSGIGDRRTPYMGPPSPEREDLWNDLYGFGTSVIGREHAAKLVNKTVPVPGKNGEYEGKYVIMLGVFHQLHCVNLLRKSLYWKTQWTTDPNDPMSLMHLEHCVDALRQAVMCSADVTPHPWVWDDGQNKEVAEVMHTCRDFDAIRSWARPRDVFLQGWDKSIRVPDPLHAP
ncbi:Putative mycotoxin biosynthesis protein UstYa [Colletotrichum destructivum]|uniref:Mycotoxin biosynthesis protein UstYa n=1 Tax=Colletotrichum destructivum TaxID=34406 RepID=A0AAX4J312_9PEZI|nr:Putative mycotoxin biosynthesis protein UstYa [Colletotrichum destructivum]